jgi:hypothetical protein
VLVTHPREREWVGATAGDICLERVLIAHDFSDRSELGLQYGVSLAGRFGAELHLLHVLREPERDAPELVWVPGTEQGLYHSSVRRLQDAAMVGIEVAGKVKPVVLRGRPYEAVPRPRRTPLQAGRSPSHARRLLQANGRLTLDSEPGTEAPPHARV